ncbi:DUF2559 family protein [Vibrio sinaloensis]|nr:DUF2559 family protein [Vibrio sinaloensis]
MKAEVTMSNPSSDSAARTKKKTFTPKKQKNFKVSLKYEGMSLKEESEPRTIAELKKEVCAINMVCIMINTATQAAMS